VNEKYLDDLREGQDLSRVLIYHSQCTLEWDCSSFCRNPEVILA